ncbi:hypothetical protein [Liquorilactobacillus sicerae]|uniref:hypothetical protein n=1 Tax=Liquorilactobacillus sicerae TaxID=1416943 RepID=UPI00247FA13E|nr:hypothetical protein [Liquorilactobacillus sicerae]
MTDLYKFPANDTSWQAYGIPTKTMHELTSAMLAHNIAGLSYELKTVIGVKQDPVFILLGKSFPYFTKSKSLLKKEFPESNIYQYSHYQRYAYSKKDFSQEAKELLVQMQSDGLDVF